MSDYRVSKIVDYLTFSTSKFRILDDVFGSPRECKPVVNNYTNAVAYDCGMIVETNPLRPQLKTHVVITGNSMEVIRQYGFTDVEIVEWALSHPKCKIGRIDLAVTSTLGDNKMHGLLPQMLYYFAKIGLCKTRLSLDKPITNTDLEIETMYIGSRKKRGKSKLFRAYDKGVDLGDNANYLIRYELASYKGADKVAERVANGQDYGGIIRSFVDFPTVETWVEIMQCEPTVNIYKHDVLTDSVKRMMENDDRWNWLLMTVAPTLAKAMSETTELHGHDEMLRLKEMFDTRLDYHYTKLTSE